MSQTTPPAERLPAGTIAASMRTFQTGRSSSSAGRIHATSSTQPAAALRERRRPRDPFPASPHFIATAGDPTNHATPERPPNRP